MFSPSFQELTNWQTPSNCTQHPQVWNTFTPTITCDDNDVDGLHFLSNIQLHYSNTHLQSLTMKELMQLDLSHFDAASRWCCQTLSSCVGFCVSFFFFKLNVYICVRHCFCVSTSAVQGITFSLIHHPFAKILHVPSAEQRRRNKPRAGKCVYQRGFGGHTGKNTLFILSLKVVFYF